MKKIIAILLFGCASLQAVYADESQNKTDSAKVSIDLNELKLLSPEQREQFFQKLNLDDKIKKEIIGLLSLIPNAKVSDPQAACEQGNAVSCNKLGFAYYQQGQYAKAEPLFQRSIAIREKVLGKKHPDVAQSLNNLAALYLAQGQYAKAEPLFQRSLAIWEKALGTEHPDVTASLNNLAELYHLQGQYAKSEPLFQRSLAILEKALGTEHPTVALGLNNLAELYETQGQHAKAEPLHQRSLVIREKVLGTYHPDVAQSLNNLAELYRNQGQYAKAEPLYQRSLAIREKALGTEHPDVAQSLNNLALFYDSQGQYAKAEPLHQRSLAIFEKALGTEHPNVASSLNNLALLYDVQGQHAKAEPLFQRSLAISEKVLGTEHPDVASSLNKLARFYSAQDQYVKAAPLFQKALRIMNKLLDSWLWGADEKTRQSYLRKEEGARDAYLTFYSTHNTPDEAFYFSLSRKGLLLRIASEIGALAKQSNNPEVQQQVAEFNALKTQLASLVFSNKPEIKEQIKVLEEQSSQIEKQLIQKVAAFKRSKIEIKPEEVQNALSSEQIIIDFLVYNEFNFKELEHKTEQIIALVVDKESGVQLIKLGELASIAQAIESYRTSIIPTKDNLNSREQTLAEAAQTLYQQLWQPLTPYLKDKKTLYIIPDGILHLLPFKALQDPSGKYLAENYHLITLSTARDIVLPPLEATANQAAIFAAPDYGNKELARSACKNRAVEKENIYFCSLPHALQEGQQINRLFVEQSDSPAKLFLKKDATEQAIIATKKPKILHLSTHGFFLEDYQPDLKALEGTKGLMRGFDENAPQIMIDNPLTRSGLAFANANLGVKGIKQQDNTDGILTALEVLALDLEGTDLVTLSACDTGVGNIKVGEGVYSLNRAFQEAGAKAVLSTLWSVDDKATAEFMQKFYTRFLDGAPAQRAIQQTQQEFMQHEKYNNPYYWAGFVMTGKK